MALLRSIAPPRKVRRLEALSNIQKAPIQHSKNRQGTTFTINLTLPVIETEGTGRTDAKGAIACSPPRSKRASSPQSVPPTSTPSLDILVAEDNKINQTILR